VAYLVADATVSPLMYNTLVVVFALEVTVMLLLKGNGDPAGV